jgi:hypothetical protein
MGVPGTSRYSTGTSTSSAVVTGKPTILLVLFLFLIVYRLGYTVVGIN